MTKITLETQYGSATIAVNQDDMNISDLWEQVIEPLLLAAGYHPETVKSISE